MVLVLGLGVIQPPQKRIGRLVVVDRRRGVPQANQMRMVHCEQQITGSR